MQIAGAAGSGDTLHECAAVPKKKGEDQQPVPMRYTKESPTTTPSGLVRYSVTIGGSLHQKKEPWTVDLSVNVRCVTWEIDTGAARSLISVNAVKTLSLELGSLRPCRTVLKTYTGEAIDTAGEAQIEVQPNGQKKTLTLFVVARDGPTLLGRDWISNPKLDWTRVHKVSNEATSVSAPAGLGPLLQRYEDLFQTGLGTASGAKATLRLKEGAVPKFCRPRPVLLSLREAVGQELDRLEREGAAKPVSTSEWATPLVVVPKPDGTVRLCGDYKVTVNPQLHVDTYPMPSTEEMRHAMSGGRRFTKLDLSQAYQQLCLDDASRKIVTVNTHKGLYELQRLPYGVASAPAIFQKFMDQLLQGIRMVVCRVDDILVSGVSDKDHLEQLEEMLRRLHAAGLRVKRRKCYFFQEEVVYQGELFSAEGVRPCNEKVRAIVDAPQPHNVTETQGFFGYGQLSPSPFASVVNSFASTYSYAACG